MMHLHSILQDHFKYKKVHKQMF